MDFNLVCDQIDAMHDHISEFWGNGGWAPPEAAELLRESRLDLLPRFSRILPHWQDPENRSDEQLILAWVTLGSMAEGALKWFLCVYNQDYKSNPLYAHDRRLKKQRVLEPDELFFHKMIDYFGQNVCDDEPDTIDWLHRIRKHRNSIHWFEKREIADWNEWQEAVGRYLDLLCSLEDRVPYPDEQFVYPPEASHVMASYHQRQQPFSKKEVLG